MAILPILENSYQQDEDAANGLGDILFLLVRYQEVQNTVLSAEFQDSFQSEQTGQLLSGIRTKLVSVYAQVYVSQIRFVLQYSRVKAHRVLRNAVTADGWKQMLADIESTSKLIDQGVQDRVWARALETWQAVNDIKATTERLEILQQATLAAVQAGNEADLLLSLPFAGNAIFDSAEIFGAEAPCLEGTQRRILSEIQHWAEDPQGQVIFWLHGMAGTGKTSVTLTVANALNSRQPFTHGAGALQTAFLGASFFFKQDDATRNSTRTFFSTLARCLAEVFPDLKSHIVGAINEKLAIGTKAPQQQLDHLVVRSLSTLDDQTFIPVRLIVVVDALDECVNRTETEELIGMLEALEDLHQVQLRLLITSRRDRHIQGSFDRITQGLYRSFILDKIRPSEVGEDDITLYLTHTLAKIAKKHGVAPTWIDEAIIGQLSKKADGLFIYAATVCRFLDADDFTDEEARQDRLDQIFDDEAKADAPQQKVDEIYVKVLSFPELAKSPKRTRERIFTRTGGVLGFISVLFEPVSVAPLGHLLSLPRDILDDLLKRLHSVVAVPQIEASPLGLVHLSFRDFLHSEERSRQLEFRVDEVEMHREIFERCLEMMTQSLHEDMCEFLLPGTFASEVPRSQIEKKIPEHLRYACRYWVDHLDKLDPAYLEEYAMTDDGKIHEFLRKCFVYWLEAMSWIREIPTVILNINRLQGLIRPSKHPTLSSLLHDSKLFVFANRWIIDQAPLQIYCSALLFSPAKSVVRSHFQHLLPSWITEKPTPEEDWTAEFLVLQGHNYQVRHVAFAPSNDLLASTDDGHTIILWDYNTGTERFRFDETQRVNCVAFSLDGKTLAAGLESGVVRLREFAKGKVDDLIGHDDEVFDIAFSPTTNNTLASASSDRTIRIWNMEKGQVVHVCRFLEVSPPALSFSPNGKFVGAGTDQGLAMWDIEKGERARTLEWRDPNDSKFAISMDGETIARSTRKTVTLWSTNTERQGFEARYDRFVRVVAFLPTDGKLLLVGLGDGTIELRNVDTWDVVSLLNGYAINGVAAVSPDDVAPPNSDEDWWVEDQAISAAGKLVAATCASGIPVTTYHLWDITTGIKIGRYGIHGVGFSRLSFSSDLRCLETDGGRLPVPGPDPSLSDDAVSDDVWEARQSCLWTGIDWVYQGTDRLLWLPTTYRDSDVDVKGEMIATGHVNTSAKIIKFDLARSRY
ncbi:hypothetical protein ACJ41O_014511 [Fusarium nematophilum]